MFLRIAGRHERERTLHRAIALVLAKKFPKSQHINAALLPLEDHRDDIHYGVELQFMTCRLAG